MYFKKLKYVSFSIYIFNFCHKLYTTLQIVVFAILHSLHSFANYSTVYLNGLVEVIYGKRSNYYCYVLPCSFRDKTSGLVLVVKPNARELKTVNTFKRGGLF